MYHIQKYTLKCLLKFQNGLCRSKQKRNCKLLPVYTITPLDSSKCWELWVHKKPDIQLNKIRKYGKARFFSFICGLGLSYPKNLETFRSDPAISSATSYHSPLPPSPQSLPPQHTLKHTGDFATVVPSATTSLPLTSLPLPRGLLAIFQQSISQGGPP